eukprot:1389409-Amorphochlora_amoeboformis.AAC.1
MDIFETHILVSNVHLRSIVFSAILKSKLRDMFPKQSFAGGFYLDDLGSSTDSFDLLSQLLAFDPKKRISAEDALNHQWFTAAPRPQALELMPTFRSANEQSRSDLHALSDRT